RRLPVHAAAGVLVMAAGYLISDFEFFRGLLFDHEFVGHRAAWRMTEAAKTPVREVLKAFALDSIFGRYHAASLQAPILAVALFVAGRLALRKRWTEARTILFFVVASFAFVLAGELPNAGGTQFLENLVPALRQVNVRFWWSLPLVWYTAL